MRGNYQIDDYRRVHDSGRDCPHCIVKVKSHQHLTTGEIIEKCHTCGRVYRDSMNRESSLTETHIDSRTDRVSAVPQLVAMVGNTQHQANVG